MLARNWRCPAGELDLVVLDERTGVLVCCEVKTRTTAAFGSPFEAVTPQRFRRLRRLAGRYLAEVRPLGGRYRGVRLDVAAVRPGPDGAPVVEVVEDGGS